MKVLIIYQIVPEEEKVAIVEMSDSEYEKFSVANGTYVNAGELEDNQYTANMAIGNALCENPDYLKYTETELDKEYFGKWAKDLEENLVDITDVEKLIMCGFHL